MHPGETLLGKMEALTVTLFFIYKCLYDQETNALCIFLQIL